MVKSKTALERLADSFDPVQDHASKLGDGIWTPDSTASDFQDNAPTPESFFFPAASHGLTVEDAASTGIGPISHADLQPENMLPNASLAGSQSTGFEPGHLHAALANGLSPAAGTSPSLESSVGFISGVSGGTVQATSFWTWNDNTPATYTHISAAHKWGSPTVGSAGGTVDYYLASSSYWTAAEENTFKACLALWSDVANIHFVQTAVAGSAQIVIERGNDGGAETGAGWGGSFGAGTFGGTTLWTMDDATISIDTHVPGFGPIDGSFSTDGGYAWMTVLHEIGHAIGLGHSGPYNEGSPGSTNPDSSQYSAYDTRLWTIMSYIMPGDSATYSSQYPVTGTNWGTSTTAGVTYDNVPTTMMPLDIEAAQSLYGASTSSAYSGGQTFGFHCNITDATKEFYDFTVNKKPVVTLWDSGSGNTLDLSGFSSASTVNLNSGTFSSCDGMVNNIGIAANTRIDKLVCGPGNDVITTNTDGDTISPGTGNDTVITEGAGDTVNMGAYLNAADKIENVTTVNLAGDYATKPLVFNATTIVNAQTLNLAAGFSYNLTTNDATVVGGQTLTVDASALGASNTLTFNGSAETDSGFFIKGGAGNDVVTAGARDNIIDGNAGNDTINMGAKLSALYDQIDGGTGTDTVNLNGDYATTPFTFGAKTMINVERLLLATGHSYNLTTNDATVAAGQTLTVDGSTLGVSNTLTFNGGAEKSGSFAITGGSGNDVITGGAGNDTITDGAGNDTINGGAGNDLIHPGAGNDTVNAGAGLDYIAMGSALTAADKIDGGADFDTIAMAGNYSLVMSAATMVNVERLLLLAGTNYAITTNNANVAANQSLTVDASALGSANSLTFNGVAETNGSFVITGGAGNDTITGGAGNDTINGGAGNDLIRPGPGIDTVDGGAGNDYINVGSALTAADKIDGNVGFDTIALAGNYSLVMSAATMVNVERLLLLAGTNYAITTNDANVAANQSLTVDASALGSANSLTFNGGAETNGHFLIMSGLGADTFTGGALSDTFVYTSALQSSSTHYDTINGFNFSLDRFDIPGAAGTIVAIDTAVSHTLSTASFDTDITAAVSGDLNAHTAMLVTANAGTLNGQTFLIVDLDGSAGYSAGTDLVIHLSGQTGTLVTGDFI